jgi:RNA polymerase sigma-70 factor (ECF subfamily)
MALNALSGGNTKAMLEGTLIQQLRAGDKNAFAQIYDQYSRLIFGLILRMVRNPPLAEDLLQEVFLKLWRSAASLDENASTVGPWLTSVARNHVLDYIKSGPNRRAMKSAAIDIEELSNRLSFPGYDAVFAERVRLLREGLGQLEARQQQVLELAYFEGLTQIEMAAILNLPLGTVKSCVRMALRNLKKQLEKENPE